MCRQRLVSCFLLVIEPKTPWKTERLLDDHLMDAIFSREAFTYFVTLREGPDEKGDKKYIAMYFLPTFYLLVFVSTCRWLLAQVLITFLTSSGSDYQSLKGGLRKKSHKNLFCSNCIVGMISVKNEHIDKVWLKTISVKVFFCYLSCANWFSAQLLPWKMTKR